MKSNPSHFGLHSILTLILFVQSAFSQDVTAVRGVLGSKLDRYLTRITPFGFSGALLVAKNGEVVLNKGYGSAVRSTDTPNAANTIFSVGSITKQFTAAAILKLESRGKLRVTDSLGTYFKDVPPEKQSITIHNLLTHTSGIVQDAGADYEPAGRDEAVRRILGLPMEFKPGEQFGYSNSGYSLLAAIVEQVSGRSYEQFLHDSLFVPSGMMATGYRIPDWKSHVVAHWYVGEKDNLTPLQRQYPYWFLMGNGGILSTTADMYRWHLALLGDRILHHEEKVKLLTPFLDEYAYGWDVLQSPRGLLIQHNGGSDLGNSAEIRRYIDSNAVSIIFCNQFYAGNGLIYAVRRQIQDLIFGGDVPLPPSVRKLKTTAFKQYTGQFLLPSGGRFTVLEHQGALAVQASGQDAISLLTFPEDVDTTQIKEIDSQIKHVFAAVLDGDYEPLRGVLANAADRFSRVKELIQNQFADSRDRTGVITSIDIVHTVPSTMQPGAFETAVAFRGNTGSFYLRYMSRDGKNIGMGPLQVVQPPMLTIQQIAENDFVGFDLRTGHRVTMIFSIDKSTQAKSLAFRQKKRILVAIRTEN